jgi:hypothetical protein
MWPDRLRFIKKIVRAMLNLDSQFGKQKGVLWMLTQEEAEILAPWINRRTMNATLKRMMEMSKQALALTLRARAESR